MNLIMGVDGGGSKTHAVITDEKGNLLGEGLTAGSNYQTVGMELALSRISKSMEEAINKAGINSADISFVQYALAGADREQDYINLRAKLSDLPYKEWDLTSDALAGLRLGSPQNIGVVLVCGSGTNAVGRNLSGRIMQTGGFGYLYGDFAGGNNIAIETFRAAIRSWEGREMKSVLVDKVLEYFNFPTMEELYEDFLDRSVSNVPADLAIILQDAVEEGDTLATQLLFKVGNELGAAANSVIKRMKRFDIDEIPIVLIGSIFQRGRNTCLLNSMTNTIRKENVNVSINIPKMEPVYGAVQLGMDFLGVAVHSNVLEKFNTYRR